MRPRAGRVALVTTVAVLTALSGCAGRRLHDGVYRSEHGYRIAVPGPGWTVVDESRADLELRRADGAAGMLVATTCRRATTRQRDADLRRHLLLGLRERETLEDSATSLAGLRGVRVVMEGRMRGNTDRVRIEAYTVRSDRCVYDLLYVAPPAEFAASHEDFARFVRSFAPER